MLSQGRVQHRVWSPGDPLQVGGEGQAAVREAGGQQGDPAGDVQGENAHRVRVSGGPETYSTSDGMHVTYYTALLNTLILF